MGGFSWLGKLAGGLLPNGTWFKWRTLLLILTPRRRLYLNVQSLSLDFVISRSLLV